MTAGTVSTIQKLGFLSHVDMAAAGATAKAGKWPHFLTSPDNHFLVEAWFPISNGSLMFLRSTSFRKNMLFSNSLF